MVPWATGAERAGVVVSSCRYMIEQLSITNSHGLDCGACCGKLSRCVDSLAGVEP